MRICLHSTAQPSFVHVSLPLVCYMNMHIPIVLCCGAKRVYCLPTSYQSIGVISHTHLGKRVTQHACSHCSLLWCENSIVYNKLSEHWCHISNPYLFTKFHTSKHLGKRVTQTCMFTLFFVVVRKGYCLPTGYQNVGVVSLIPTCLPSFIQHPSILVRELHKLACPIVMYGPKLFIKSKVFTKTYSLCVTMQSLYLYQVSYVGVLQLVRFANSTRRRRRR